MKWKVFAFSGAVAVAGLLIWGLLLRIAQGFGFSTSNTGALLSVLGSIMGAIFAAAGIAVALIALFEQMQLRGRVEGLVAEKFSMLRSEYEEQLQNRIDASRAFFKATDAMIAGNWRQAETLVQEALHKNPRLQGVSSVLGMRMSEQVHFPNSRCVSVAMKVTSQHHTCFNILRSSEPSPKIS